MKRLLSVCLVFCLLVAVSACSERMSAAENALIAVKAMDMEAFSACMTKDSEAKLSRVYATYETDLDADEKETLKTLYGLIRYTMGEELSLSDGAKQVSVTVKLPDMARVRTLAEKKILVSAETASTVVSEMLASGEIENNYMLEAVWQIKLIEEDGKWLVAYADPANEALVNGLYLSEMFTFFAQY